MLPVIALLRKYAHNQVRIVIDPYWPCPATYRYGISQIRSNGIVSTKMPLYVIPPHTIPLPALDKSQINK